MVRVGASVVCKPLSSLVVFMAVQTNVARNAFRAATMSQYITSVQPIFFWTSFFRLICLTVLHGEGIEAGAAAQVPDACHIYWFAPD